MDLRKQRYVLIICLLVFLLGIGAILYPIVSAKYAESVRSEIHTDYQATVETVDTSELQIIKENAQEFNRKLFEAEIDRLDTENNGYFDQLSLNGSKIMAYVIIPKINVTLPIYHGTSDDVLKLGAGHMPQSSLPVGGINTHAVISAHSGMASNPMFSDLELLELGDLFHVEVLGETLTYEVNNIEVVLPQEVDFIQFQTGADLMTLITCTPYGVNSHRLLVQGYRIETPSDPDVEDETLPSPQSPNEEPQDSIWLAQYQRSVTIGLLLAIFVVFAFIVAVTVRSFICENKRGSYEKE